MNKYDADQTAVIQTEWPQNLIIAGAGSGKTATLIARIAWMLRNNFDFGDLQMRDMVVITFTNQAADEISRRLAKEFGAEETDTTTAHAALGYCGTLHGFCLRLIREHGHIFGLDGKSLAVLDSAAREALVLEVIEFTKYKGTRKALDAELAKGPPIKKFTMGRMDELQIVASKYYSACRQHGVIDYDSILFYGLAIVRSLATVPWKALFVDEFQDSGKEDFAIYRALPISHKFFVGDPDQAIYSFRGGRIENILSLSQAPGIRTHRFERNYRSDIAICEAATRLIRHNKQRIDKVTASQSKAAGSIQVWRFDGAVAEVNAIGSDMVARDIVNSSAILVRTNPIVRSIAEILQGKGIQVAQRKFVERPHDWPKARALVSFLANPYSDRLAFNFLAQITNPEHAEQMRLDAQKAMKSLNAFAIKVEPMGLDSLPAQLAGVGLSEQSIYNVMETRARLPLRASMAELGLALSRDLAMQQEGTGVVVATMHAAKGREWDNVYLPAFEQGICPLERVDSNLEEERRLAYVAMTRARHRLVISFVKERNTEHDYTLKPVTPSQFVTESGHVCNP